MSEASETPTSAPSGMQWQIAAHGYEATITEVGGALRTLTHEGRAIVFGYPEEAMADASRGHILMPWPNRIRDGKYSFGGNSYQLALTEPGRHNASHGLAHWANWSLVSANASSVCVGLTLHPQPGWVWTLRLETTYTLSADGLRVTSTATNLSSSAAPFGYGAHPYLTTGEKSLDELTLTAAVSTQLETDEQAIPVGTAPASGFDETPVKDVGLDTCFTDITADDDIWHVTIARGEATTTLWAEAKTFPYVQLFTGDGLPEPRRRASGLAVEPMTCPANAFNSGEGLITLAPGAAWSGTWGITRQLP